MPTLESLLSLSLTPLLLVSLAVALVSALYILLYFLPLSARVRRRERADAEAISSGDVERIDSAAFPSVSVIVYVDTDATELVDMLPLVLEQDYPAPMEVIVVNDGSRSELEGVLGDLELRYRNLYMTFTPEGSRNLSRKKMSLTIGVKAARYDTLMMTNASVRPTSPLWLRAMASRIAAGDDVVIGHSVTEPSTDAVNTSLSRRDDFDLTVQTIRYLSRAIAGSPYRADGNNLMYRKEVFTANRGFSSHHNFKYGDDDIFISEVSRRGRRIGVQLAPESVVRVVSDDVIYSHKFDKLRFMFTGKFVAGHSAFTGAVMSWAWWLWLLSSITAIAAGYPSIYPLVAVTLLSLGLCLPVMISYRKTATALFYRRLLLTVPWLFLAYPFYNLKYKLKSRRNKEKNLTWVAGRYS